MDIDCYVTMPHSLKRVNISVNIQSTVKNATEIFFWGGGQTEGHACPDV